MPPKIIQKVVFLDRDGTINQDSAEYVKNRSEFKFIPGSIEAIRELTCSGFTTIVITNQSALARNLISFGELDDMHGLMKEKVVTGGGKITDIFFCPHMPGHGCDCRKPKPGLLRQAQHKYNIDLSKAVMVGDSAKDIECGLKAGCGKTVLVKTGRDSGVEKLLNKARIVPDHIAENLYDAARWIIADPFFKISSPLA